ncbi:hypothetical protein [Rodentibacter genomosp. 2]|uniref:hypothetical protein n=1 Tax=Rodentibacter genomosp. 2 TaxID=1908266 RepID=UPI00117B688F|nr:hypothetical protein [Rodentibacter genomosp. 2]
MRLKIAVFSFGIKDAEIGKIYRRTLADSHLGIGRESKAIFGIDYDCPKCVSFSLKNRANVTLERGIRQVFYGK